MEGRQGPHGKTASDAVSGKELVLCLKSVETMERSGKGVLPGAICGKCMGLVGFYQGLFLRVTH